MAGGTVSCARFISEKLRLQLRSVLGHPPPRQTTGKLAPPYAKYSHSSGSGRIKPVKEETEQ